MWTSEAPTSNASWVDTICSDTVTGSAGLSFLRGTEPVIATAMTTGFMANILPLLRVAVPPGGHGHLLSRAERDSTRFTMDLEARKGLTNGHDLQAVDVQMRRQCRHPEQRFRDVPGGHRIGALVCRLGSCRVAAGAHERELGFRQTRFD